MFITKKKFYKAIGNIRSEIFDTNLEIFKLLRGMYNIETKSNNKIVCQTCGFEIEKEHPMYTLKYPIFKDCEVVGYETSHYCIEHRPKTWRCDDPRNDEPVK